MTLPREKYVIVLSASRKIADAGRYGVRAMNVMRNSMTINEFAKFSGTKKTTLRYWDEIGLFSPSTRNPENGYRYYSPEQIFTVNFIAVLSDLDIPLKTIGAVEKERSPEAILELMEKHKKNINNSFKKLINSYSIIHTRRELIQHGLKNKGRISEDGESGISSSDIFVAPVAEYAYILGPPTKFGEDEDFYGPFMRFCNLAREFRINLSYPIGGYHQTPESFLKAPGKPDFFFSIDPTGNKQVPAGEYLKGFVRGFYGKLGDLPTKMSAYAARRGEWPDAIRPGIYCVSPR